MHVCCTHRFEKEYLGGHPLPHRPVTCHRRAWHIFLGASRTIANFSNYMCCTLGARVRGALVFFNTAYAMSSVCL